MWSKQGKDGVIRLTNIPQDEGQGWQVQLHESPPPAARPDPRARGVAPAGPSASEVQSLPGQQRGDKGRKVTAPETPLPTPAGRGGQGQRGGKNSMPSYSVLSAPVPPGAVTGQMPPGAVTGQMPPGAVTGQTPPGAVTGQMPPGGLTGQMPPGAVTGQMPPGAVTGQMPPGAVTGQMPYGAVTGQMPYGAVTGRTPYGAVTGQTPPGAVTGQMPPGGLTGQMPYGAAPMPAVQAAPAHPAYNGGRYGGAATPVYSGDSRRR